MLAVPDSGSMPCRRMISKISSRNPEPRMSIVCEGPCSMVTLPESIADWIIEPRFERSICPSVKACASPTRWPTTG